MEGRLMNASTRYEQLPLKGSSLLDSRPDTLNQTKELLNRVALRATKPRLFLWNLLFKGAIRHVPAEMLFEEAKQAYYPISLATIYNTLREFTEIGLLRHLRVDGAKSYYDTDVSPHQHFYLEEECQLIDMPGGIRVKKLPAPPAGYLIDRFDVVIRLRRAARAAPQSASTVNSGP
jgi:Fur family transcriptional regulator, iron response regulator